MALFTIFSIRCTFDQKTKRNHSKLCFRFLQRNICSELNYTSIFVMQKNKIVKSKSHRETHSISYHFQLFASDRGRKTASFLLLLLFIIANHQQFHLDGCFFLLSLSCHLVSFHFVRVQYIHILSIEYIYRWCVCFLSICQKAASKDEIEWECERKSHLQFQFRFSHLV